MVRLAHWLRYPVFSAAFVAAVVILPAAGARGQLVTIEPDDYAAGTALMNVSPHVTLMTLRKDGEPVPLFTVTSAEGDLATTDRRRPGAGSSPTPTSRSSTPSASSRPISMGRRRW